MSRTVAPALAFVVLAACSGPTLDPPPIEIVNFDGTVLGEIEPTEWCRDGLISDPCTTSPPAAQSVDRPCGAQPLARAPEGFEWVGIDVAEIDPSLGILGNLVEEQTVSDRGDGWARVTWGPFSVVDACRGEPVDEVPAWLADILPDPTLEFELLTDSEAIAVIDGDGRPLASAIAGTSAETSFA